MTEKGGFSRRGLLGGLLRRPLEGIRETLPPALAADPARPAPPPAPGPMHPPRRLRPRTHTVAAVPDPAAPPGVATRFLVDLNRKPLEARHSWRVAAAALAETLVLVRVNETHYAATTGECPLDFSDLHWKADEDRLWCPSCGSLWRLDGTVARGPARRALLPLLVDECGGLVRIDVP